ncbi:MAG: formylglycine-generating enzyme family protein [Myxococcales bacterium]|nr:formylglycine-generating enzyme family protein [Myxococcales bacterium]
MKAVGLAGILLTLAVPAWGRGPDVVGGPATDRLVAAETPLRPALLRIPAGTFVMGSPADEVGRYEDEAARPVTLTAPLAMMQTEVTQGQWTALMGSNPSLFKVCGPTCPVEQVSWLDAVGYANALSKKEGLPACYAVDGGRADVAQGCAGYRLPTEAEWEYAARAGTTDARHGAVAGVAWFDKNSGGKTHPVAQKQPNAWGLYDMLGNVLEWTGDWHAGDDAKPGPDPSGPPGGQIRVIRGGSWVSDARRVRAAVRDGWEPGNRVRFLGFRLVRRP